MSKKPVLMPKAERREAALAAALKLAKKVGARRVSMAMVAAAQKVTAPLLFHIFESREGLTKAIVKAAKAQGIVLPDGAPTVREQRAANRKAKLKKLPPLKKPVLKPLAVPAKNARPAKLGKVMKDKVAAKPKKVAAKPTPRVATKTVRKPLTPAQKTAKAQRDAARRAVLVVPTPASKFASLPAPFEASIAGVA